MDDFEGHTPRPWSCVHNSWEVSTVYAEGHEVARCYISPDVTEETQDAFERVKDANAHLIAAAPDLLAERNRLRAEVERLREALSRIAEASAHYAGCREAETGFEIVAYAHESTARLARAALAQEPTP